MSTEEQCLDLQLVSLTNAKCDQVFANHGTAANSFTRNGLTSVLATVSHGDELVVWRLYRLGRALTKLVALVDQLVQRGVQFISLTEHIDTRSADGMLMFHLIAALAQFERY